MKAVLCKAYGPPDSLVIEDVPSPVPGPGEAVVSVKAASVNFPDVLIIENKYQVKPPLPFSPGSELAGIVKAVGDGVTHVKPGDRVMAITGYGAFAEEVNVEARRVLPIPAGMDFSTAAAFGLTYATSEHALFDRAALKAGETLLVLGAAGGVGLAAIEIGKILGARVIACASTDEKLAICRQHGADETINYVTEDLRERIKALTAGNGADVVYDPVGGSYTELALRSIAWRGRLLVVGFAAGEIPKIPLNLALLKGCSIVGVFWGDFTRRESKHFAEAMARLAGWYADGRLKPHISETFPLERAADALKLMAARKVTGKVGTHHDGVGSYNASAQEAFHMSRRLALAFAVALTPALALVATPAASTGTSCANLAALTIPNVTIKSATPMPAGPFTPPGAQTVVEGQPRRAPMTLPAFCRVEATARPTSDSEIKIEVWLPPAEAWNGKFQGVGNGGYQGSISYAAMATALRRGYATASTDTGHSGDDMKFGQGHPEKLIDYAYRAVHVMTDSAKLIIRDANGKFADKSYFVGCSAGGQQALSEAQRYPEDYDGIVAGDPANNRIRQTFAFLHSWIATHDKDGKPIIPQAKLALLTKAATEACDGIDGLKDGIIDDPRRCHFDPAKLLCKGADEPTCLTAAQVESAKKTYDGVKNPRTGEQIFTGWTRGSEGFGDAPGQSWRAYLVDPQEPSRVGFFKYWLFHDPNWDYKSIDWEKDLAYAEQKLPYMAAVDKDLAPFKKHGGKLLMYTGWSDPVVPPQDTVAYYDGVVKAMGGMEKTRDFYRFFIAPGMGHCSGGPGPNQFDHLTALEQWVEKGVAPEKLIASHSTAGKVDRTRPLCTYPLVARWKGTGSSDDAAHFSCVAAPAAAPAKTATTGGQQ